MHFVGGMIFKRSLELRIKFILYSIQEPLTKHDKKKNVHLGQKNLKYVTGLESVKKKKTAGLTWV